MSLPSASGASAEFMSQPLPRTRPLERSYQDGNVFTGQIFDQDIDNWHVELTGRRKLQDEVFGCVAHFIRGVKHCFGRYVRIKGVAPDTVLQSSPRKRMLSSSDGEIDHLASEHACLLQGFPKPCHGYVTMRHFDHGRSVDCLIERFLGLFTSALRNSLEHRPLDNCHHMIAKRQEIRDMAKSGSRE
ncbi:hypothetical protein RvY_04708 [Ramazzottius varieornatus]|uniref:Uncharacterized protein n=1 Tax=Ramazzottius varieornatus TaxID=947166 RepID=A0A1D1USK6_RAMVA|nr:hypothetical protein RvY_04708 [Ramazzottius varieornatus]